MNKKGATKKTERSYQLGDEVSYATPNGMMYGTVVRVISDPSSPAVEVEFEDGKREIKKVRDRALHLVRRASGKSELDERRQEPLRQRDTEIEEVRRSDQRRGRYR
ncbi:MAG: hypothetical protein RMM17_10895 [Acidobacteriota bacterium]|nr:hypothetical protein [Blastocatellia bacterium]MDW8413179.1 hypothetical protein [Acidobacteriota bacterium]